MVVLSLPFKEKKESDILGILGILGTCRLSYEVRGNALGIC
jgi:hypothetical protein